MYIQMRFSPLLRNHLWTIGSISQLQLIVDLFAPQVHSTFAQNISMQPLLVILIAFVGCIAVHFSNSRSNLLKFFRFDLLTLLSWSFCIIGTFSTFLILIVGFTELCWDLRQYPRRLKTYSFCKSFCKSFTCNAVFSLIFYSNQENSC